MRKITKIWVLWLALCMLLSALNTNANVDLRQKLELKITTKSNSCTMSEYDLGSFEVSDTERTINLTWANIVRCELRENAAQKISLQLLVWLKDSSINKTIDKSNFKFDLSNVSVSWTLSGGNSVSNTSFATATKLYDKGLNQIGVWSWTLKIWWTIPAWTPSGTYTWEINLLIQAP